MFGVSKTHDDIACRNVVVDVEWQRSDTTRGLGRYRCLVDGFDPPIPHPLARRKVISCYGRFERYGGDAGSGYRQGQEDYCESDHQAFSALPLGRADQYIRIR